MARKHLRVRLPAAARRFAGLFHGTESRRGATAVEFAFAAPVVIALMLGVMESGRAVFTQMILYHAAQEATRWAVANPKTTDQTDDEYNALVKQKAESKMILISQDQMATVSAIAPPDPTDGTRTVSVQVSYDFRFMLPISDKVVQITSSSEGFLIEDYK